QFKSLWLDSSCSVLRNAISHRKRRPCGSAIATTYTISTELPGRHRCLATDESGEFAVDVGAGFMPAGAPIGAGPTRTSRTVVRPRRRKAGAYIRTLYSSRRATQGSIRVARRAGK